jgi:hypothetical protein
MKEIECIFQGIYEFENWDGSVYRIELKDSHATISLLSNDTYVHQGSVRLPKSKKDRALKALEHYLELLDQEED